MRGNGNGSNVRRAARPALAALAVVVGLVGLATPAAATVYKWMDAQGRIHYSDLPPPPDGKLISIEQGYVTRQRQAADRPASPPPATPPARPTVAQNTPNQDALRRQVADDVENARAEQCKAAQERYKVYVTSPRLFRTDDKGERVYLTDAELNEARVTAKRDVDEFCGSGTP